MSYLDLVFYNSREKENRLLISDLSAIAGCFSFLIFKTDFRFNAAGPVFVRQYSLENKNSYEKRNYVKLFSTF